MKTSKQSHTAPDTSRLILEAAGRIFAQNGFHATTVRQITREAGVNIAAVNYHFGDKQELYVSVLKHAYQAAARTAVADLAGTPKERLRAFIRAFLGYLLDPQRPAWQGHLIAREMARPTPALDRLVAESAQPVKKRIRGIVRDLVGPEFAESNIHLACFSIIGQCLFYVHCREMIARLFPEDRRLPSDIERLAEHVFTFSLAGLEALKHPVPSRSKKSAKTSRPSTQQKHSA